jgi:TRAP-type C4-dicarboxylate transport system permease small subunit
MKIPQPFAKAGRFLVDVIEVYVPVATFCVLFISFITQIIARYFFKPLLWPEELSLMCFVWTALLGGLYAKRDNSHVAFSMLYDAVKPRSQALMRVAGDALMLFAFLIALVPSWKYVSFMAYKKSDVLLIPMNIVFFPFMVFLVDMIVRVFIDMIQNVKSFKNGGAA